MWAQMLTLDDLTALHDIIQGAQEEEEAAIAMASRFCGGRRGPPQGSLQQPTGARPAPRSSTERSIRRRSVMWLKMALT